MQFLFLAGRELQSLGHQKYLRDTPDNLPSEDDVSSTSVVNESDFCLISSKRNQGIQPILDSPKSRSQRNVNRGSAQTDSGDAQYHEDLHASSISLVTRS